MEFNDKYNMYMQEMKASDIRDIKKCAMCKKKADTKEMRDVNGDLVCPECYGELERYDRPSDRTP